MRRLSHQHRMLHPTRSLTPKRGCIKKNKVPILSTEYVSNGETQIRVADREYSQRPLEVRGPAKESLQRVELSLDFLRPFTSVLTVKIGDVSTARVCCTL